MDSVFHVNAMKTEQNPVLIVTSKLETANAEIIRLVGDVTSVVLVSSTSLAVKNVHVIRLAFTTTIPQSATFSTLAKSVHAKLMSRDSFVISVDIGFGI